MRIRCGGEYVRRRCLDGLLRLVVDGRSFGIDRHDADPQIAVLPVRRRSRCHRLVGGGTPRSGSSTPRMATERRLRVPDDPGPVTREVRHVALRSSKPTCDDEHLRHRGVEHPGNVAGSLLGEPTISGRLRDSSCCTALARERSMPTTPSRTSRHRQTESSSTRSSTMHPAASNSSHSTPPTSG